MECVICLSSDGPLLRCRGVEQCKSRIHQHCLDQWKMKQNEPLKCVCTSEYETEPVLYKLIYWLIVFLIIVVIIVNYGHPQLATYYMLIFGIATIAMVVCL